MKNKRLALLLLFLAATVLGAVNVIDENEYIVRPGDKFLVEVVTVDTVQVLSPVLPEGKLSLHPVGPSIPVAGLTLKAAKDKAYSLIQQRFPLSLITVELGEAAPVRFQLLGAVIMPGEKISPTIPSLFEAITLGRGMLPQASRKVTVTRNGTSKEYDLRRYLIEGDTSQNPLIQDGDRIMAVFAESYVRISTNNDTTLVSEYYELDRPEPLRTLLLENMIKYHSLQYTSIRVIREDEVINADLDFEVRPGDAVYLATEERFVYVLGYVLIPGRYLYNGPHDYQYYINLAGGYATIGSRRKVTIISPTGEIRDKDSPIRPGDTIRVPEGTWFMVRDYLSPVSVISVIAYYIYVITH